MKKSVKYSSINIKNYKLIVLVIIFFLFILSVILLLNQKTGFTNKIALIPIEGTIGEYDSLSGSGVNPDEIISYIEAANKDNKIKAIILDINSPGGTVVASEEIANAVSKSKKPVVAFIRELGASGAYWIASSSDKIVASKMSITGSIGVTSSYLEFSKLMEKYGVTYNSLKSGEYKDTGSPYKELTEKERKILQTTIDKIYDYFIEQVSVNRNISESKVREIATGMIYLGDEAKDLGLIDDIGDKDKAVEIAKKLANVSKADIVKYQKQVTLVDILQRFSGKAFYNIGVGIGDRIIKVDDKLQFNA